MNTPIRIPRYNEVPHMTWAEAMEIIKETERRHEAFMRWVEENLLPAGDQQDSARK
jgi:hypothetical protein